MYHIGLDIGGRNTYGTKWLKVDKHRPYWHLAASSSVTVLCCLLLSLLLYTTLHFSSSVAVDKLFTDRSARSLRWGVSLVQTETPFKRRRERERKKKRKDARTHARTHTYTHKTKHHN